VQPPTPTDSRENGSPTRLRLFLAGILGLLLAALLTVAIEGGLRLLVGDGLVPDLYFVAAAALTPVLALGLLVQLVTAMTGRTRLLLREVTRFEEEMSAEPTELNEDARNEREFVMGAAQRFVHVVGPFVVGLALQLVVAEAVAIYCVVADVAERAAAVALGLEIIALFVYLLFFNAIVARLGRGLESAARA